MSEIRVNKVTNAAGSDAPNFPYGFSVSAGYGITGGGNVVGTAATFSGAVNVDATTDSTSVTTGALIVDGGLGIAKNVYIGAGLSVAGTLTYQDVTEVDAVGLITAQSGVNVSGGEVTIGTGITMGIAGVATFSGTGDIHLLDSVRLNLGDGSDLRLYHDGSHNYVKSINGNLRIWSSGSSEAISCVQDGTVSLSYGNAVKLETTNDGTKTTGIATATGGLSINADSKKLTIGVGSDLTLYHDGSHSFISNQHGTGNLVLYGNGTNSVVLQAKPTENGVVVNSDSSVQLYWDGSERYATTGAGSTSVGISTVQDFSAVGMLKERVEIVANKLSAGTNVDLAKGNVWYYSTNETTTATPNFRYDGTDTLNNKMLIGDTVTAVIISKPNGAGYYAACTVDGGAITEEWLGGSAPSAANAGGYDVTTHTLTKTANATFICLSNVANYA